jgi:hypothetical protein
LIKFTNFFFLLEKCLVREKIRAWEEEWDTYEWKYNRNYQEKYKYERKYKFEGKSIGLSFNQITQGETKFSEIDFCKNLIFTIISKRYHQIWISYKFLHFRGHTNTLNRQYFLLFSFVFWKNGGRKSERDALTRFIAIPFSHTQNIHAVS